MTKTRSLLAMAAFMLASLANVGVSSSSFAAESVADKDKIVAAATSMLDAAASDDLAKFHAVVAADFRAFDNGKRFAGDELMQLVKQLHAAGTVFEWHVTEPDVHVHGDTGWISYINRGSVQNASGKKDMAWLESAVLRKEKGVWRIHFFHSTRVP
jgi:ketosteroid isomerase-like protein